MKVQFEKEALSRAIHKIKALRASKNIVGIFDFAHMLVKGDSCYITYGNGNTQGRVVVRCEASEDFQTCLYADTFFSTSQSLRGDYVKLEIKEDKNQAILKGEKRQKYQFPIADPAEYIFVKVIKDNSDYVKVRGAEFGSLFASLANLVKESEIRKGFNGVNIGIKDGRFRAFSTNAMVIKMSYTDVIEGEIPLVCIPKGLASFISGLNITSDVSIHISNKAIKLELGDMEINSVLMEGAIDTIDQVVKKAHESFITVNTDDLYSALNRAISYSAEGVIDLDISEDKMVVTTKDSLRELKSEEEIDITNFKVGEMKIRFNYRFLMDSKKLIETEYTRLHIQAPHLGIYVKDSNENNSNHVWMVMPVATPPTANK
jgi:DNA polymerase-3 subunit beta